MSQLVEVKPYQNQQSLCFFHDQVANSQVLNLGDYTQQIYSVSMHVILVYIFITISNVCGSSLSQL